MNQIIENTRYLVLTGNYGSGKTELALNLAMQFSGQYQTTLVDEKQRRVWLFGFDGQPEQVVRRSFTHLRTGGSDGGQRRCLLLRPFRLS